MTYLILERCTLTENVRAILTRQDLMGRSDNRRDYSRTDALLTQRSGSLGPFRWVGSKRRSVKENTRTPESSENGS